MRTTGLLLLAFSTVVLAGDPPAAPQYKVEIKDGATALQEMLLPIDPVVRVNPQHSGNIYFGITVDGKRITCSPMGSIWPAAMIDGQVHNPVNGGQPLAMRPLPKTATGKERRGFLATWQTANLQFTQTVEVIPSKPITPTPGAKRKLDTCRISYLIENKDTRPHEVAFRTNIDMLINNNDGALYASPTTEPGKVLNGVVLEGKKLPKWLMAMENADANNPGFYGVITFDCGGRAEQANKIVLTNLSQVGQANWDVVAQQAGDSACSLFWEKKSIKPGEKRELVWAYGGGIATNPENDGKVTVALGGNLEPGKMFTVSAIVEDPVPSQTLAIELPAGMERVEGAEVQPVPLPNENGYSLVMWKGRVTRPGAFDLKIRSSNGVTQTKSILVQPLGGGQ